VLNNQLGTKIEKEEEEEKFRALDCSTKEQKSKQMDAEKER
jgi:hypothetical protein